MVSGDFPSAFLSPSPEDDDTRLDFDLDAMETPSDSESLPFPISDMDLEGKGPELLMTKHFGDCLKSSSQDCFTDDLWHLGVAFRHQRGFGSSPSSRLDSQAGAGPAKGQSGLGPMEKEDIVDNQGTRWRCFSTGDPPQESRVNMSVLDPFLRVLSHGGTDCCIFAYLKVP